jgi:hypothetical protein
MMIRGINWIMGELYQHLTLPKHQRVNIPIKSTSTIGLVNYLEIIAQTQAMYMVSYPLIVMAKSGAIINVILVSVLCSRVKNQQNKLGCQQIIIAVIVTLGILIFRFCDPTANLSDTKST